MSDNKLREDEQNRIENYENVKSNVGAGVNNEIASDAARSNTDDQRKVSEVAESLHEKAIDEVAQTSAEVERGRAAARISQIVDYLFF